MKIAILTMFNGLSTTYSLVNVVADQLKMLLENGHTVKLLVTEHCPESDKFGIYLDKRIQWVKITNTINNEVMQWRDYSSAYGEVHDTFFEEASLIKNDFVKHLRDVDVCIMHDILYQGWHLLHNVAIREAQKRLPYVKFLEFTHSIPANHPGEYEYPFSLRYTPMRNTIYVYPTYSGIQALADQYEVTPQECGVVYNSMPLIETMSEEVQKVNEKMNLLETDIIIVYPARLTTGKKFEKVVMMAGAIKQATKKSVKVILCDFSSMDIYDYVYKKVIKGNGVEFGLNDEDILFTSDIGYKDGFPRKAVLELFTLSNLFICPSFSESFGLTVLEAASRGNFIVLNKCVPALEEIGNEIGAYFMNWDGRNFGFDTTETYHPDEETYYRDHAKKIIELMEKDIVLRAKTLARTKFGLDWIYENQLLPLLRD